MLTRKKLRRGACWLGVAVGAVALLTYIPCVFTTVALGDANRSVILGRGAVALYWRPVGMAGTTGVLDPGSWQGGWWRWLPRYHEPDWTSANIPSMTQSELVLPLWLPAAIGLVCLYVLLPERGPAHLCECGYDVSAVPAKDGRRVCPECGRGA